MGFGSLLAPVNKSIGQNGHGQCKGQWRLRKWLKQTAAEVRDFLSLFPFWGRLCRLQILLRPKCWSLGNGRCDIFVDMEWRYGKRAMKMCNATNAQNFWERILARSLCWVGNMGQILWD
jgi:hypothetical protein